MNTTSNSISTPVLVVGAGPAGLVAAITMARNGVVPTVVERHSGTSVFPRATGVSTRTMEILRGWGLDDQVRASGMNQQFVMSISCDLSSPRFAVVPMGYPSADEAQPVSPTWPALCPQDHLEPVLLAEFERLGGRVLFDTELVGFEQTSDGICARTWHRTTGVTRSVQARYVVAADGANGSIRRQLGIPVHGPDNLGTYVSALFRADFDPSVEERRSALHMIEHPTAGGIFLPTGRENRWVYAHRLRTEPTGADQTGAHETGADRHRTERGAEEIGAAEFTELIRAASGHPRLQPEIMALQTFRFAAQVAETFRSGDVFLIGDAAHRMTPMGGMGMNTAIHDGHNLGWKLAWVISRLAHPALLDTYESERRPVGVRNTLASMTPGAKSVDDGMVADLGVVYGSAGTSDDAGAQGFSPTAVPGARAPHVWVTMHEERSSVLDLFDGRLTLLTGKDAEDWRAAALAIDPLLPFAVHTCGVDFEDTDGSFHDAYGIGGSGAVLVRPDGHVVARYRQLVTDPAGCLADAIRAAVTTGIGADGR